MRKLLTWMIVTVGIAALVRRLRRRGSSDDSWSEPAEPASPPASENADPADELRRRLAETREDEPASADAAPEAEASVDDLRADVHEEGRAVIDEMQRSTED
jgi:hypothetical protein